MVAKRSMAVKLSTTAGNQKEQGGLRIRLLRNHRNALCLQGMHFVFFLPVLLKSESTASHPHKRVLPARCAGCPSLVWSVLLNSELETRFACKMQGLFFFGLTCGTQNQTAPHLQKRALPAMHAVCLSLVCHMYMSWSLLNPEIIHTYNTPTGPYTP